MCVAIAHWIQMNHFRISLSELSNYPASAKLPLSESSKIRGPQSCRYPLITRKSGVRKIVLVRIIQLPEDFRSDTMYSSNAAGPSVYNTSLMQIWYLFNRTSEWDLTIRHRLRNSLHRSNIIPSLRTISSRRGIRGIIQGGWDIHVRSLLYRSTYSRLISRQLALWDAHSLSHFSLARHLLTYVAFPSDCRNTTTHHEFKKTSWSSEKNRCVVPVPSRPAKHPIPSGLIKLVSWCRTHRRLT